MYLCAIFLVFTEKVYKRKLYRILFCVPKQQSLLASLLLVNMGRFQGPPPLWTSCLLLRITIGHFFPITEWDQATLTILRTGSIHPGSFQLKTDIVPGTLLA